MLEGVSALYCPSHHGRKYIKINFKLSFTDNRQFGVQLNRFERGFHRFDLKF